MNRNGLEKQTRNRWRGLTIEFYGTGVDVVFPRDDISIQFNQIDRLRVKRDDTATQESDDDLYAHPQTKEFKVFAVYWISK